MCPEMLQLDPLRYITFKTGLKVLCKGHAGYDRQRNLIFLVNFCSILPLRPEPCSGTGKASEL